MDSIFQWLQENTWSVLILTGVLTLASLIASKHVKRLYLTVYYYFIRKEIPMALRKTFPRNKVILVQIMRGPWVPCISSYCLKMETFLRMANIPYQNVHGFYFSSKDKIPWILYNDIEIADTNFIIEFLNKEKGVDLNQHLNTEEKAISRAFQKMVEENTFWTGVAERYVHSPSVEELNKVIPIFNRFTAYMFKLRWSKNMWGHGMGRHSLEEIRGIMLKDMRALSCYLGDKKFFMGDEPSEIDCALFGLFAQPMWQDTEIPHAKLMKGELKNMGDYCERMRERFWPDWDDCITHGFTRKATK